VALVHHAKAQNPPLTPTAINWGPRDTEMSNVKVMPVHLVHVQLASGTTHWITSYTNFR